MLLSPLSQPVVRALYNGANNRVARDTPSSALYVIRHLHSNDSCIDILSLFFFFFSRTKNGEGRMYVFYRILHLFYTSFLLLQRSHSFAQIHNLPSCFTILITFRGPKSQIGLFLILGRGGVIQVKIFYSFTGPILSHRFTTYNPVPLF